MQVLEAASVCWTRGVEYDQQLLHLWPELEWGKSSFPRNVPSQRIGCN